MTIAAEKLIADFELLPLEEKQAVLKELISRQPVFDSGAFDDYELALAADRIAAMLKEEEDLKSS